MSASLQVSTKVTGNQVVEVARGFVGVPFKLHGRDKEGIDCIGLILAVAREFGLTVDYSDYGLAGMKFEVAERLLIDHGCLQISADHIKQGDIFTARNLLSGDATGVGIISGVGGPFIFCGLSKLIHCETVGMFGFPRMRVVEDQVGTGDVTRCQLSGVDPETIARALRFYRYPFVG